MSKLDNIRLQNLSKVTKLADTRVKKWIQRLNHPYFSCSVQSYCSVLYDSLWPHGLKHARLLCSPSTAGANSNSCPSSQWCHPVISSSAIPFSSHFQSSPASGPLPMSQLFALHSHSIGVSDSASVFPKNIQYRFPLGSTGWISLQSEGLSRVSSNTTIQKHQVFGAQLSS